MASPRAASDPALARGGQEAHLPLAVTVVPPAAVARRRAAVLLGPEVERPPRRHEPRVLGRSAPAPPDDDLAEIEARLAAMEAKIDGLIAMAAEAAGRRAAATSTHLWIAPSGITFRSERPHAPGDVLELCVTLALLPARSVRCLVEVTGCSPAGDVAPGEPAAHLVATRFRAIGERDLDAIHGFVLAAQRRRRAVA